MERLILVHLNEWYVNKDRKPLLICGARQVGKTYLIKEQFAKQFKDFVYIDFLKDDESRSFFSDTCDPRRYLDYIEARFNKKVTPDCPLIMDEIQECPKAIVSMKYFCQDYRDLPVIATGSLARAAINRMKKKEEFSFPVGKVNVMNMYPMTFEEYLMNTNPALLRIIRESYHSHRPLDGAFHEMALDRLYEYLAIGGMPEALDRFVTTGSYVETGKVIAEVYGNYLADMSMYNVSDETILKTRNVYENIFSQLNKENKNFKIGQVEHGKSNRDYFNAYMWLELARVVYRSRKTEGRISLPLNEEEQGLFRYYLADQGMFVHQSRLPRSDFMVRDKRNVLSGIFYENYVADELMAKGIKLFYWTGKGSHEIEFIVQNGSFAVPIDVKKTGGKMGSLEAFRAINPRYTAVKISSGNYGYDSENDLLSIPLYQTFLLAEQLSKGEPIRPE